MKKLALSFVILVTLFYGCEEVFYQEDISQEIIRLVAPSDDAVFDSKKVIFSWNQLEGTEKFHLQIVTPSFINANRIVLDTLLTTSSFEIELIPNQYQWRVRGTNSAYATGYSSNSFEIVTLNPAEIVKLLSPENNLITNELTQSLSWQPVAFAENYRLQLWKPDTSGALELDIQVKASDTTITFNEGAYMWQIRAENDFENTAFSSHTIFLDNTPPNTPALIAPENAEETITKAILFDWERTEIEGSSEIDSLFIFNDETLTQLTYKDRITESSIELELSPNTYYWYVQSSDIAGNTGEKSAVFSLTILESISSSSVELLNPEDNIITNINVQNLSWNPVENATDYNIQILKDDGTNERVFDITIPETEREISFQDGAYQWQVKAQNILQETAFSTRKILVDTKVPNTPVQEAPIDASEQVETIVHFEYDRTLIEGSAESDSLFVFTDANLTELVLKTEISDSNAFQELEIGTYYWYLQAFDVAGNVSEKSSVKSFSILENISEYSVELTDPQDNLISNINNHILQWNAVDNAVDYNIQILKSDGTNELVFDIAIPETEKEITFQDGAYQWQVKAGNSIQETAFSSRNILIDTKAPNTPVQEAPIDASEQVETIIHFEYDRTPIEGSAETDSLFVFSDANLTELVLKTELNDSNAYLEFEVGTYYWYLQAYDAAGNESESGSVWTFTILENFISRVVELISPANELISNTAQQTLTWNAVDNALDYRVLIHKVNDNIILSDYTLPITSKTVSFDDGYYTWKVRAQNNSQNTDYTLRNILIDTTTPNIAALQNPTDGVALNDSTIHFVWNRETIEGSIEKSTIYVYDDIALTNLIFSNEVSGKSLYKDMIPGTYYWYVISSDEAGNVSEKSSVFSFTVQ